MTVAQDDWPSAHQSFLNDIAPPHVTGHDLAAGYAAMVADEARKAEAEAWSEVLVRDVAADPL